MKRSDEKKFEEFVQKGPLYLQVLTQHDGVVTKALKEAFVAGIKSTKEKIDKKP
jgi:hypothetical protein